MRDKRWSLCCA